MSRLKAGCCKMNKENKKIVIYGDSISTTEFGGGGYQQYLEKMIKDCEIYNFAVSSSGLTAGTPDSLVKLLDCEDKLIENSDIVIIWHGTNDWYWGSELGNSDSENENCFYGAIKSVIKKIRSKSPFSKIVWLTPLHRFQAPDGCKKCEEAFVNKNKAGNTLEDYCDAIISMSKRLSFPVIDMRTLTNFNEFNASLYQPDNIHPSKEGYSIISKILSNFIGLYFM